MEIVITIESGKPVIHPTSVAAIQKQYSDGDWLVGEFKKETRTGAQNRSIHVYCQKLAKALNDAGLSKIAVLEKFQRGVMVEWTMESVKEDIWRQIQKAVIHKKSTTSLDTKEVNEIYENVNRFTGERLGVTVDFPCRDSLMNESR